METIQSMMIPIYFGLFFIFYMMVMFYMSLKHRLRQLDRDLKYAREESKEWSKAIRSTINEIRWKD